MISTDKEFNAFGKLMSMFALGELQNTIDVKTYLKEYNYTLSDLESYVYWKRTSIEEKQKVMMERYDKKIKPSREALNAALPKCPNCSRLLYIYPINAEKGKGNIHGYKSVWQCIDKECVYEEYSKETAFNIISSLIGIEHTKNLGYKE